MKNKIKSPVGQNAVGAGPRIFAVTLPVLLAGVLFKILYPVESAFPFQSPVIWKLAGGSWLGLGSILYVWTLIQFLREFPGGNLITRGMYRISRNPIYSSWILFILPGLSLVSNDWIFLLAALVMYIALNVWIGQEETELTRIFGEQYLLYHKKVGRILPFPVKL